MWLLLVTTVTAAAIVEAGYYYNPPKVTLRLPVRQHPRVHAVRSLPPHLVHPSHGIQEATKPVTYTVSYKTHIYVKTPVTEYLHGVNANYNNQHVQENVGVGGARAVPNAHYNVGGHYHRHVEASHPSPPAVNVNTRYMQSYVVPTVNTQAYSQPSEVPVVRYSQVLVPVGIKQNIGHASYQSPVNTAYENSYAVPSHANVHGNHDYSQTLTPPEPTQYQHQISSSSSMPAADVYKYYVQKSQRINNVNVGYSSSVAGGYNNGHSHASTVNNAYSQELQPPPVQDSLNEGYSQTAQASESLANSGHSHTVQSNAQLHGANAVHGGSSSVYNDYSQAVESSAPLNNGYSQSVHSNAPVDNTYTQSASLNNGYSQTEESGHSLHNGYSQTVESGAPLNHGYGQGLASSLNANVNADYAHSFIPSSNAESNSAFVQAPLPSASTNPDGFVQNTASSINLNNGHDHTLTQNDFTASPETISNNAFTPIVPISGEVASTEISTPLSGSAHIDLSPTVVPSPALGITGLENNVPLTIASNSDSRSNGLVQNNLNVDINPTVASAPVLPTVAPIVHKHIYFHVPPPDVEEPPKVLPPPPPPQKNYKILFIKVPSQESKTDLARIQQKIYELQNPAVEEKTLIYVLAKTPEEPKPVVLPPKKPSEHEVFFVKYNGSPFDIASQINEELDKTGAVKSIVPVEPELLNVDHK